MNSFHRRKTIVNSFIVNKEGSLHGGGSTYSIALAMPAFLVVGIPMMDIFGFDSVLAVRHILQIFQL